MSLSYGLGFQTMSRRRFLQLTDGNTLATKINDQSRNPRPIYCFSSLTRRPLEERRKIESLIVLSLITWILNDEGEGEISLLFGRLVSLSSLIISFLIRKCYQIHLCFKISRSVNKIILLTYEFCDLFLLALKRSVFFNILIMNLLTFTVIYIVRLLDIIDSYKSGVIFFVSWDATLIRKYNFAN